ncbi:MAG: hypothetical protein H7282_05525 [Cytophagaceae bacterium]|nr:hypothetical protein [Cytophagaceae bacterium]
MELIKLNAWALSLRLGAVGVHEKSELKKTLCGINFMPFKGSKRSSLIGFRGALFFCFFSFGRSKEKKKDGLKMTMINTIGLTGSKTLIL